MWPRISRYLCWLKITQRRVKQRWRCVHCNRQHGKHLLEWFQLPICWWSTVGYCILLISMYSMRLLTEAKDAVYIIKICTLHGVLKTGAVAQCTAAAAQNSRAKWKFQKDSCILSHWGQCLGFWNRRWRTFVWSSDAVPIRISNGTKTHRIKRWSSNFYFGRNFFVEATEGDGEQTVSCARFPVLIQELNKVCNIIGSVPCEVIRVLSHSRSCVTKSDQLARCFKALWPLK